MKIVTFNVNGLSSFVRHLNGQAKRQGNVADQALDNSSTFYGANLAEFLTWLDADVVCFQETKLTGPAPTTLALPSDAWDSIFVNNCTLKKGKEGIVGKKMGYSGVATFWKRDSLVVPRSFQSGLSIEYSKGTLLHEYKHALSSEFYSALLSLEDHESVDAVLQDLDSEGRLLLSDHRTFILVNVYLPLGSSDERIIFKRRYQRILEALCRIFVREGRTVILVGDLNATYTPLDNAEFASAYIDAMMHDNRVEADLLLNTYVNDMTNPGRSWLSALVSASDRLFVDPMRPSPQAFDGSLIDAYTCWNTVVSARKANYGTRIDYILVDRISFEKWVEAPVTSILATVLGSDHCPVRCDFNETLTENLLPLSEADSCLESNRFNIEKSHSKLSSFFFKRERNIEDLIHNSPVSDVSVEPPAKKRKPEATTLYAFFPKQDKKTLEKGSSASLALNFDATTSDRTSTSSQESNISAWQGIFTAPPPPHCIVHNDPCTIYRVNKKGKNHGRSFYLCSRPVGPPSNPEARCSFFKWKTG